MASKSALKRKLVKQGAQVNTVTTQSRVAIDNMTHAQVNLIRARASFGLSFSLDTPTETPIKWSRISHKKRTFKRYGIQ